MKRFIVVFALVVSVALLATSTAEASFRLRVEDLSNPGSEVGAIITDDLGADESTTTGYIKFTQTVGAFSITLTAAQSKPILPLGGSVYSHLKLTNMTVATSGAGSIRVTVEDTDYTAGPDTELGLNVLVGGTLVGLGSSVTVQSWVDPTNDVPDLGSDQAVGDISGTPVGAIPGTAIPGLTPTYTSGPGPLSAFGSVPFTKSGAYSLFGQVTVVFGSGGGTFSLDEDQVVVPEPATCVIWSLLAAMGVCFYFRRRRKAA